MFAEHDGIMNENRGLSTYGTLDLYQKQQYNRPHGYYILWHGCKAIWNCGGVFFNIAVSLCGNVLMLNISVKFPGDGDSCFSRKVPIFGEGQM